MSGQNRSLGEFGVTIEDDSGEDDWWADEETRRQRYVDKLEERCDDVLPRLAEDGGWPVRFDHCFRRICYDVACGGHWKEAIDGETFIEDADFQYVQKAACIAIRMIHDGPRYAERVNEESLAYRGKIEAGECEHISPEVFGL